MAVHILQWPVAQKRRYATPIRSPKELHTISSRNNPALPDGRTRLQQQVINLLLQGYTNLEISAQLNIAIRTVNLQLHNVAQSLGYEHSKNSPYLLRVRIAYLEARRIHLIP